MMNSTRVFSTLAAAMVAMSFSVSAHAEEVANPTYTEWAKYKPGTSVTHTMDTVIKMAAMPTPMQTTGTTVTKLVEVKPTELTLEVTIKLTMAGQEMNQPVQKRVVPAKVEKGKEVPAPEGAEVKDMKDGSEKVEVGGKSYEAKTHEMTLVMKQPIEQTTKVKTWNSAEIPGGMVKTESTSTGQAETTTKMTLTEVKIEK